MWKAGDWMELLRRGKRRMSDTATPKQFRLGVRGKIALILFATLLVTLGLSSLLSLRAQEQDILSETDRRGREAVQFIAQRLAYNVVGYDYHTLELLLADIVRGNDIVYARVDNNRGNAMAVAGIPATGEHIRSYNADIRLNGDTLGQLRLEMSTERIVQTLATRQREVLVGQLLTIMAVLLVGFAALSVLIVRPLTRISQVIGGNLNSGGGKLQHISLDSNDEFMDLAEGFNTLQARLDDARHKLESRVDQANLELRVAYEQLTAQANDLRTVNQELEQLSITDPLTGLFNRRYFSQLMESEVALSVRNDETISIILLDIDHFKSVNDRHGYNGGDAVIRDVAQIIAERTRRSDIACRYGGDEFFILCRRATIANVIAIANDLHDALAEKTFRIGGQELQVTVSLGVATIPGVHQVGSAMEFFQCADEALRHGKQRGRNSVVHYSMIDRSHKAVSG
jgi:diguanylate cyclase (GGDEF)-like protein